MIFILKEIRKHGFGNVFWYSGALRDSDVEFLKMKNVFFNRYPRIKDVAYKKPCGDILNRMNKLFPEDFNFYPIGYNLPEDQTELRAYMNKYENEYFIAKPSSGTQGNGIKLVNQYSDVQKVALKSYDDLVVQKYIKSPLLINK
jgi:predicted ATP-grasp superfamily ATP-dependent carboligase